MNHAPQTTKQPESVITDDLRDAFEVVFTLATCQLTRCCCQALKEGEAALNLAGAWLQPHLERKHHPTPARGHDTASQADEASTILTGGSQHVHG